MNKRSVSWTQADLKKALQAVGNGMSKRMSAKSYGIPWGTFSNKLMGRRRMDTSVPKTYLSPEEEDEIANIIKQSSDSGFGMTKGELLLTVKEMLDFCGRKTKWADNMPNDKWFQNFKLRHPQIDLRAALKLGEQRAFVTKGSVMSWFQTTIESIDAIILLDPTRIYNPDESGFSLDAGTGRVLAFMGTKCIYQVGSEQKTVITALVCCSASGHYTWPMLIYSGSQFRWFRPKEVFAESFITNSPNGWTNQTVFSNLLESVFILQTSSVKKLVLLLVDGHIGHKSIRAASLCKGNGIILYALPPHSSHLVQPLDVGVFNSLATCPTTVVGPPSFPCRQIPQPVRDRLYRLINTM